MKTILLAAAAFLATPVIAQTTPAPADPAMQAAPADPAMQTAPADPAMPAPPADPAMAPADPSAAPMAPPAAPMAAPAGGVTFGQPTVTPPTPAPAEYPVCSKTVTDGCRNRGGK
ncbi:hypothetical protein EQZ23_16105 [Sphingomonas sp. UV9]|uniref:hypothetical protein n=1 Tax=Sphingomonas sp. UV9 TaxID=1851410 RepID=UPI000FFBB40B|nr:hypothetical protein [Sphingomonas sp. UV9]RXD03815.1 hypothetical protein EQZ23_16105 [Sphingomonas sp. UV9]